MRNCPHEIQIALFAEGHLSDGDAKAIRQHIALCQECSHLLADMLSINDLLAIGLLPSPSEEDSSRSADRVRQILEQAKPQAHTLKDRRDTFFGMAATFSLGMLGGNSAGIAPLPAFTENHEEFSGDAVRNSGFGDSTIDEEHKRVDHQCKHEGEIMYGEANNGGIQDAPKVIGLPGAEGKSASVQQNYQDTCAVKSQELILRDFGVQVSEDSLRQEALDRGWYTPGSGTSVDKVGNLLELHGVEVSRYENANIFTLTDELAKGHKVIIGVDSGELANKGIMESLSDMFGFEQADHALVVSGIDTSDPAHVKVVLTDPGNGDIAKEYPMDQFVDAWKDSNCFMVTTKEPAPAWLPEMKNFDYNLGHIESVGNLSYDDFQTHYATPEHLQGHDFSSALDSPVDDFLQGVMGHDLYPMPLFDDITEQDINPASPFDHPVPEPDHPVAAVDNHPAQPEPTIAELIAQQTHPDPNELLPSDTSEGHLAGHTALDDLHPHV